MLDEPTSGLDPNQLQDIRALIKELGKHKTVMFSSHIMQEVEAVSDRIIIIDKGKLVTDRSVVAPSDGVEQKILVEFESEIDIASLQQLEGVVSANHMVGFSYSIEASSDSDIRKTVAKWAKDNDILVLSLKIVDENLEDVFRKHTS